MGRSEKTGDQRDPPALHDKELFQMLFGLSARWSVQDVDLQVNEMKVTLKTDSSITVEVQVSRM